MLCRDRIVGGFFLQPTAPRLRLLRMSDRGMCSSDADRADRQRGGRRYRSPSLVARSERRRASRAAEVVALAGHVMIDPDPAMREAVGELIRELHNTTRSKCSLMRSRMRAWFTAAVVMALWFVWAFDVQNGYHASVHIGGWTVASWSALGSRRS
jgi:hypothetical protein